MRDRQDVAGGTLDRLNDALSSLEGRIGIARQQASQAQPQRVAERSALSSIRARQDALTQAQRPATNASVSNSQMNANVLREELTALRSQMEKQLSGNVDAGFESIRSEMRSLKSNIQAPAPNVSAATLELRQDIAALKNDVALLAREDTLQDMLERWGVLEREIAELPQKLNTRDDFVAMAERLDDVQNAISVLPQSNGLVEVEEQVRTLAVAVERLAANSDVINYPIESIDSRFDELSRALAALPASFPVSAGVDPSAFERIEARIAALASQLDDHAQSPVKHGLDDQLSDLASGLDQLREETRSASSTDALADLSNRIEEITQHLVSQAANAAPLMDDQSVAEMNDRLVYIIEQMNHTDEAAQKTADSIVASFDQKMDEIAKRIDENERNAAAIPSMDTFEMRLDEIAQLLSNSGNSGQSTSVDQLASLEAQVSALTKSLSGSNNAIDEESLLSAARAAAEEAVARFGANNSNPAAVELNNLAGDLKALEELARDSDDRNSRTFGAIHDTLLKVVDHLAGLEDTMRSAPVSAQTPTASNAQPAPSFSAIATPKMSHAPETARMNVSDAPSVAPLDEFDNGFTDFDGGYTNNVAHEPRGALSPAKAAAAAARSALEKDSSDPVLDGPQVRIAATEKSENNSLLKGMAQKLRMGASKAEPKQEPISPLPHQVNDEMLGETFISDEPIEPGSGGADLSAIMRRVREERAGTAPNSGGPAKGDADDSGKSDFIAAARRAAKAAAADATVASRNSKPSKGDKASLGAMLAQKRKPILMGAGAILLALLSLPLISGYFSSGDTNETTAERVEEVAPALQTPSEPAVAGEAVRNVGDGAAVVGLENPLAIDEGAPDSEASTEINPDVAPASELSLSDVPENVGPIAMREAAVNGDPVALYIVGDYYTGGVPGASENDLGKALQWYERSAELGYAPAQYRTGNFYEKGLGTQRDFDTAKTWYQLAAEQGNAAAMHNLAVLYASGAGGAPDFNSATRWFLDAAELGVKDSQFNLGILTAKGEGVTQDLAESYKWFAIAAKTGDKDAEAKRNEVADALRPDQLEAARGATDLWKPKELIEEVNIVSVPEAWQTDTAQTAAAKPAISGEEMKKAVRNIQGILNNNGYNAGPADGVMGSKTAQAIIAFKKANGLDPTPDVTETLVRKLLEVNSKKAG